MIKENISKNLNDLIKKAEHASEIALRRGLENIRSVTVADPDFPVKTGRLKASIAGDVVSVSKKTDSIFGIQKRGTVFEGVVGTNVEYALKVEFGSKNSRPRYFFTKGFNKAKINTTKIINNSFKQMFYG